MSEKDFLRKLWLSVASGIIVLILAALATMFFSSYATAELSKRNEKNIESLSIQLSQKEDKGTSIQKSKR